MIKEEVVKGTSKKSGIYNILNTLYKLEENNTNIRTEIMAGFTTFITMAYIVFVNPSILKQTGMDFGAVLVATCISAAIGTFMMSFYANYPFAQAPGMGLNAFFTYTVVLTMGYTWQQALGAVFISGIIFILITISGIRQAIVDSIPMSLKHAVSGGIGLFIALIGFKNAGIVVSSPATIVTFGHFTKPDTLLALIGLIITGILMVRGIKGSILLGILLTTIIGIPMGIVKIPQNFTIFSMPPSLSPTFLKMDIAGLLGLNHGASIFNAFVSILTVILAFTFVDMFDTIGTLIGTGTKAGMVDKNGKMPRIERGLLSDAIATTVGAILGTSTVTTYVESAAGVMMGGRTGLTSLVTGLLLLGAMFFSPLIAIVPSQATAPALIIVGVLMMGALKHINFEDFSEAMPAFFTVVSMPFSFSIANGIAAGLILYPIMKIVKGQAKEVHPIVYILAILFIIRFIAIVG